MTWDWMEGKPLLQAVIISSLMHNDEWTHCGLVTPYGDSSGSTLVQVMACCLMAPSHYLNQWWPFFVFWCHMTSDILGNIGSGNNIAFNIHQAITWTNAGSLSIRPLRTNLMEILIKVSEFSFMKKHSKWPNDSLFKPQWLSDTYIWVSELNYHWFR